MNQSYCEITEHTEVIPGSMVLKAISPEIAASSRPGQFVNVICGPCMDPLLRRPFSIYCVNRERNEFALLYQVRGRGTSLLSQKRVGEKLDVVGPIGRSFEIDTDANIEHFLVGGGCGIVPLLFLSDVLKQEAKGKATVLIGAQSADAIMCEREFLDRDLPVELSTDDGSVGRHGFVTDLLLERLDNLKPGVRSRIYACGPHGMLRQLAKIAAERDIPCQVSLESAMACGFGVCMGCVTKAKECDCTEDTCEDWTYKRVCVDGPVFYTTELVWE